jgi:hypothetical protein
MKKSLHKFLLTWLLRSFADLVGSLRVEFFNALILCPKTASQVTKESANKKYEYIWI